MRCSKCGYDAPNGEKVCPVCGDKLPVEPYRPQEALSKPQPYSNYQYGNQNDGARRCPECGYPNCQILTDTTTQKADYNSSSGCLGCLLFGPLGLLCGSCGNGKKTVITNYWYCPRCGNKFNL